MPKKPIHIDLTFDVSSGADHVRPAEAAAQALQAARRSAAEAVSEADRRAFADTEPAFMDTQAPTHDGHDA